MRALHNAEIDHPKKEDKGEERRSQLQILPTAASLFHPVAPFRDIPGIPLTFPVKTCSCCLSLPSYASQHHEEHGRLLQHPKRGVGGIISSYVIISQSSSSIKISSIAPSSSSVISCVSLGGIMDLGSIHLNFKHSLDEKRGGDLCPLLQLFSY